MTNEATGGDAPARHRSTDTRQSGREADKHPVLLPDGGTGTFDLTPDHTVYVVSRLAGSYEDPTVFHLATDCGVVDPVHGWTETTVGDVDDDLRLCKSCESLYASGERKTVAACPECGSAQINTTRAGWWCRCGATFEEPRHRAAKQGRGGGRSGLAGVLEEADPDDLVTDGGTETVYLPTNRYGTGRGVYHTDPDCRNLKPATEVREVELNALAGHCRECKTCAGEREPTGGGDGHYASLKAAANSDNTVTNGGGA